MQKLVREYLNELKSRQKKRRRTGIAFMLLVVMVVGMVGSILTQYGVAMTGGAKCQTEEHAHGEACYEERIVCGLEESAGHTHEEGCYATESQLVCGLEETEEHIHEASCYAESQSLVCGTDESAGHIHDASCYESQIVCGITEHSHTEECYIDIYADVEDAGLWDAQYAGVEWTDAWGEDLATAARMQVGYKESTDNYMVAEDGSHKGYTRYGQFSGDVYVDWDAALVNFCVYYAGLKGSNLFPDEKDTAKWCEEFGKINEQNGEVLACLTGAEGYEPEAGDIIFFDRDGEERTNQMGIVSSYNKEKNEIKVIEGNSGNEVKENTYDAGDAHIVRYLKISELEKVYKGTGEEAQDVEEAQSAEAAAEETEAVQTDEVKEEGTPEGEDTEAKESEEEQEQNEEGQLSEEELSQVDEVIALIDDIPSPEEIQEKMEDLEDDEEEYEKYYLKLQKQVLEAFEAYEALSEVQQEKVTNAEKLLQMDWMKAETLESPEGQEKVWEVMQPDEAYVNEIKITKRSTGTEPFDSTEGDGNDTTAADDIVRTYDTVSYQFEADMKSWDITKSYSEARVKLEFVLPLTEKQAVFDQTAMAWMDQTEGYKPVLSKATRTIGEEERECQVLTCYKKLLPSNDNLSVVPGKFGENVTINVLSMKNGDTFAPIISAAMEGGAWDEPCDKEEHRIDGEPAIEKKSVTAEPVKVTAAPRYNIQLDDVGSYKDVFDFQGGDNPEWLEKYKDIAANTDIATPIPGRLMKLGITLQLYNDNAAKGLKGIELPTGEISFDLDVSSKYTINNPVEGHEVKEVIDTSKDYQPLLWSYGPNSWMEYGEENTDGRVLYDQLACSPLAPYSNGGGDTACWNSGMWRATQDRENGTIHVTVNNYEIDVNKMPILNGDNSGNKYGVNIGCFSSAGFWIIQPFNKIGDESEEPNYQVVKEYGTGSFATTVDAKNLTATTVSDKHVVEGKDGFEQMRKDDDSKTSTLELTLEGGVQNRIRYGSYENPGQGAGIEDNRNGRDYAAIDSKLNLVAGLSYNPNGEARNRMYLGTNLTKFYGSAIELESNDSWWLEFTGGAELNGKTNDDAKENMRIRYATKKDGKDWVDDYELQHTYEDDLVFYESLESIPEGYKCVGILFSFIGPGAPHNSNDPYYYCYYKARVRNDKDLIGKTFMLASTSRVWTKSMFEEANMTVDNIPDWADPNTKMSNFPDSHYKSGNINVDNSEFYIKETYREDGSGVKGTHNSDWYHWGDTLLVIGYKTKVSKYLMQKNSNDSNKEKDTFNLDADQRVVDFKLEPATYYDKIYGGEDNFGNKDNIKIIDTLPKYLNYRPGSSYFGGEYEQTSINGGTQGNIIDSSQGEFKKPILNEPTVTNNEDGTQTLTWTLTDVEIGKPMAPIYYSADIGKKGNPDEDVPVGTTNLKNEVYITAPGDMRDPASAGEKHSEAGIAVTRGSASSFGKYTKQKVVDEDGVIDYVVYYNNNAETEASLTIMDTMPMNGTEGSEFTGTYHFTDWKLDTSKCDISKIQIYYTFDKGYKDKTTKDVNKEEIKGWKQAEVKEDGSIAIPGTAEGATEEQPYPVAWAAVGTLGSGGIVNIELKIQLDPGVSKEEKTKNNYFVNRLSSGDTTTKTETPTVKRTLEGLTWMDYDRNGLQGDSSKEIRISGVKVELLKLKENGNPDRENEYEPVYYQGTEKNDPNNQIVIETGQQVSLRAKSKEEVKSYADDVVSGRGRYKFTDLPAGTYAVRFTDGTGSVKITDLHATSVNSGDDVIDSDAVASRDPAGKLIKTTIMNLNMPKAEEMSVSVYESKYNDSGFYPDTQMKIEKVSAGTGQPLNGAIFTLKDEKGETVSFVYDEKKKGYTQYDEDEDASRKGKYYIALASNPYYVIGTNHSGDGALPILQNRTGSINQLYEIYEDGKLRSFKNMAGGKWLDLDNGNLDNGAKIHHWSNANPNTNEKWQVKESQNGGYVISPSVEGGGAYCIDLNANTAQENQNIHLYTSNNSDAQRWLLIPAGNSEESQTDLSVGEDGKLTIHNLKPGNYTITEIKAPNGYSLLSEPLSFTLETNGTISTQDASGNVLVDGETGKQIVLQIKNEILYELPSSGGMGIYWYMFGGVLLMSAAAFITYRNKRREVLRS